MRKRAKRYFKYKRFTKRFNLIAGKKCDPRVIKYVYNLPKLEVHVDPCFDIPEYHGLIRNFSSNISFTFDIGAHSP